MMGLKGRKILSAWLVFTLFAGYLFGNVEDSCYKLFENTPKKSVIQSSAKNILGGMVIGALMGALLSKDRDKGAILGAIAGAGAGVAKSIIENRSKIRKKREDVLKELGYKHIDKPLFLFKSIKIDSKKLVFKAGDYIPIVLRFINLKPDANDVFYVNYIVKIYKDGRFLGAFSDKIVLPQGEVSDYFVIPVCGGTPPGKYTMEVSASSEGETFMRKISWIIRR